MTEEKHKNGEESARESPHDARSVLNNEHQQARHDSKRQPASQGYIVYDSKKCSGCASCMLACSLVHQGAENPALSRIQIIQTEFGRYPEDIDIAVCRQCLYPECVDACPTGACHIATEYGNVRVIDEKQCLGKDCMLCIEACPYIPHRIVLNHEKNACTKCDLCLNTPYWDEEGGPGGKQACIEVCPMKALSFVSERPAQRDAAGYDVNLRNEHWATYGLSAE